MEKVDFLFIHPSKFLNKPTYCIFPVGVVGLMNLLKEKGYIVKGINYGVEKAINKKFDIRKYLENMEYKVVGIDLHWHEHCFSAVEIAKICKEVNPLSLVIFGGFTSTIFAKEILEDIPQIDFIIKGDAEEPLLQLMDAIFKKGSYGSIPNISYRNGQKVIENPTISETKSIDNLNFVNLDFFENSKYQFYIKDYFHGISRRQMPTYLLYIGRGCLYDCISCGGARKSHDLIFGKQKFILRTPEKVISDIKYLFTKGVKRYLIVGDLVMAGRNYWKLFFTELQKENIKPGLFNDVFQLPDEEFIKEFSKTVDKKNSQLIFSPLSGDEDVRRCNGKLFSNSDILNCLKICNEEKLKVDIYFQVYLPHETEITFNNTINLVKEMTKICSPELLRVNCMPVKLDPSAPMRLNSNKFKIKHNLMDFKSYYHYSQRVISKVWNFKNIGYEPDGFNISLIKMQAKWLILRCKIFLYSFFDYGILKKRWNTLLMYVRLSFRK